MSAQPTPINPPETPRRRPRPRLKRRRRWRGIILVCVVGLWVAGLGTWVVLGRPNVWRDWLAKMKLSGSNNTGTVGRKACRKAKAAKLAYFDDGRAELGQFSIRMFDPLTRTTLRTDFRLEGRTVCPDKQAFDHFMQSNHRLFREQVMVTLRNCQPEELADPDLRLLGRKLVARVNRALDRQFLKSVEFKDFALFESVENAAFVQHQPTTEETMP